MGRLGKAPVQAATLRSDGSESDSLNITVHQKGEQKGVQESISNHLNIWWEPFDMSQLPQLVILNLMKRAPFLLGNAKARYPKDFFTTVGGLCDDGIPFKDSARDIHDVPFDHLLPTYVSLILCVLEIPCLIRCIQLQPCPYNTIQFL
jgi:hypothetical protein